MRRTAWDYIWIDERDLELTTLEEQAAKLEEERGKGKQRDRYPNGGWVGPSEMKGGDTSTITTADSKGVDETSHWGTDGVGVKVWLRRTIIYQLINLMERIVF